MNRLFFTLLIILFVNILSITHAHAAILHAILVADSNGAEFEMLSNIDYMKREIKRIAVLTDLELNALAFEGRQVRKENILHHISALDIQPDDIVILYFNLHGSRTHEKENQWPDLNFLIDIGLYGDDGYLDFNHINDIVKNKQPRFILSLADSCNGYRDDFDFDDDEEDEDASENEDGILAYPIPDPAYEPVVLKDSEIKFYKETAEEDDIDLYRYLFLDQQGCILISSSSPGEHAIKLPVIGGVYTVQFLRSIHDAEISFFTPSWQSILEDAAMGTQIQLLQQKKNVHTPQFEINLN